MKKVAEEILKDKTAHTLNINSGSPLHIAVIEAMEEYASQQTEGVKKRLATRQKHLDLMMRNRRIWNEREKEIYRRLDDILEQCHDENVSNMIKEIIELKED